MNPSTVQDDAKEACRRLLAYCRAHDWAGHDPYDALNSKLFTAVPFLNSRLPRLIATQAMKRSPLNLRGLLGVPPTRNPKAMALFLNAALELREVDGVAVEGLADSMVTALADLRSPGVPYWCWGYSFPWQTRTLVVPRATPNLVCTTFVADALLNAYERLGQPRLLTMATSAAEYIVAELYREGDSVAGFSYPLPSMAPHIHNANLLAAALLCRVFRLTGQGRFREPALKAARWSSSRQRPDGSWPYGEGATQQWVDNFHTGYNLGALRRIGHELATTEFEPHLARGFAFYLDHFFREDGAARYFHNRTHPIDIHCVAQSLITLVEFSDRDPRSLPLAHAVCRWALDHMWDERGFFYYRVLRFATIRTSYMRWSQAWMLLALATLLRASAGREAAAGETRAMVVA